MSSASSRPSSRPPFWDERYAANDHLFGTQPNAFVASQEDRILREADVLELGAGEGRTLLWLARRRDVEGTAVDFSRKALEEAERWAAEQRCTLRTIEADVRHWTPDRKWDAVVVTFLQLLPSERPALYQCIRDALLPGGVLVGEWFRPDHLEGDYDRVGPSRPDRMVPVAELREAFSSDEIVRCEAVDARLEEGPLLRGHAAVARLVVRRST